MNKYLSANIIFLKFCKCYADLKRELPVRPSEMAVLDMIVQEGTKFTPFMIAEKLDVSKPMITAHIASLEKKSYIKKEYLLSDRRSFYVVPTDKATELVKSIARETEETLQRLESELGSDTYEKLLNLLTDTNKIMAEMK